MNWFSTSLQRLLQKTDSIKGETLPAARCLPQESWSKSNSSGGLVLGLQFTQYKVSISQNIFVRNKIA